MTLSQTTKEHYFSTIYTAEIGELKYFRHCNALSHQEMEQQQLKRM